MKKITTAILALLIAAPFFGQETTSFNKFSIEVQGGLHVPLQLVDNINASDYTDFKTGQVGVRYMFNECFGAKLSYGFNSFEDKENSDFGLDYHRVTLEGVYNMQLANRFGILAHAGLGYASAAPSSIDKNENTAIFTLGLTPQVKLSDRVAVFVDATYLVSASQHYYFNGQLINPNFQSRTAAFATFGIGATIYLGKNTTHADWIKKGN
jgi:OOP family OmpA-OmpF porin